MRPRSAHASSCLVTCKTCRQSQIVQIILGNCHGKLVILVKQRYKDITAQIASIGYND